MFRRAMMTIVAVMVAACGSMQESRRSEETLIEWNNQGDQEHLDSVLAECEAVIGMDITPGAHIIFMDDVSSVCKADEFELGEISGCYFNRTIFVKPRTWLGNTFLCHELYHRELFIRTMMTDGAHTSKKKIWSDIYDLWWNWIPNHCTLIDGTTVCD